MKTWRKKTQYKEEESVAEELSATEMTMRLGNTNTNLHTTPTQPTLAPKAKAPHVMDFQDNIFDFYSSSSPCRQLHLRSLHPTDISI
jgi:hypothetical protein